jgi:23S rRNA pseudouridine2605 synthase
MRRDRSEKSPVKNPKSREERKKITGRKQDTDKKPDNKFSNKPGTDRKLESRIRTKKESDRKPEGKIWDKKETTKKPFKKSILPKKDFKSSSKPDRPVVKKGFRPDEKIRLNRFLSNSGVCSRREADTFIQSGCVTVNGKIVSELGSKVSLNDDVRFNGQQLNPERKVYLLLNKPKGFVTTTEDPQERKTVMDLIENACPERIYPVGRLDKDTTGLLLFTNDGDLVKKLTHPSHTRKKIYQVFLDKPLTKNHLLEIAKGVELEDGFVAADSINYVDENDKREIGIEIHSGQNRVVRRIFSHLGYEVQKLDRVYFAGLTKKNLPRGKWRFLTQMEINQMKMQ